MAEQQQRAERVLFVTPWLEIGGAERIVLALVNESVRQGYYTAVAAAPGSLVAELPNGVDYTELRREWAGGEGLRNVLRLATTVRRIHPSVVNVQSLISGVAVVLACLLAWTRPRLVLTIHSTGGKSAKLPLVGLVGTLLFDRVIPVSDQLREQLIRWSPPWRRARVRVVRAGVRVHDARGRSGQTVAIVGRLVELKGHRLLLDAWSALLSRDEAAGWSLEIWGDGPERDRLSRRLQESDQLRETVVLRGPVRNAADRLVDIDLLVLPSLREGLPLVLIEAMAAGVAVLAADLPGCRELVGDEAGVLFPPGDVSALTRELGGLIEDGERRSALGLAGMARVRENFSRNRMLEASFREMGLRRAAMDGSCA
jgi:glycosyltransferase involved in cell wall biosynthesis